MSPRPKLVAGNWKMHLRTASAAALASDVAAAAASTPGPDVAVFPTFVHLAAVREALRGSRVALGAQACHERTEGAHTGEIAAEMLADVGVSVVLVGHSERRQAGETDAMVAARVRAALGAGLRPLVCVGETLAEREASRTDEVLVRQTSAALDGLAASDLGHVDLAYEPVWAIGTGRTATPETAVLAHRTIRAVLSKKFGTAGAGPRILYGGSVKPSNAAELMSSEGVDGVLVGGASLEGPSFRAILAGAVRS
jgi:triosephosphate isomerase